MQLLVIGSMMSYDKEKGYMKLFFSIVIYVSNLIFLFYVVFILFNDVNKNFRSYFLTYFKSFRIINESIKK